MGSGKKSPKDQPRQVAPAEQGRGRVVIRVERDPLGGWRVVREGP